MQPCLMTRSRRSAPSPDDNMNTAAYRAGSHGRECIHYTPSSKLCTDAAILRRHNSQLNRR